MSDEQAANLADVIDSVVDLSVKEQHALYQDCVANLSRMSPLSQRDDSRSVDTNLFPLVKLDLINRDGGAFEPLPIKGEDTVLPTMETLHKSTNPFRELPNVRPPSPIVMLPVRHTARKSTGSRRRRASCAAAEMPAEPSRDDSSTDEEKPPPQVPPNAKSDDEPPRPTPKLSTRAPGHIFADYNWPEQLDR